MKRLAKIALLLLSLLLLCSIAVIAITQTGPFRVWLRRTIERTVREETNGALTIGAIQGNLITGVRLDSVVVTMGNDTLAAMTSVTLRYNPLRLPSDYLALAEVSLLHPHVFLARPAGDSLWNVQRFIKPPKEPAKPFVWTIDVRDLTLLDGTVVVNDANARPTVKDTMSPTRCLVEALNLSASCRITTAAQDITINHVSFREPVAPFTLRDLAGTVYHAPDTTHVEISRLVTERSSLAFTVAAGDLDSALARGGEQLARTPLTVSVSAPTIDTRDLALFVPSVPRVAMPIAFDVEARGTPANLVVKSLVAQQGASELRVSGTVTHLTTPAEITADVSIVRSRIDLDGVAAFLPPGTIPELQGAHVVILPRVTARMTPAEFTGAFTVGLGSASVKGTATLGRRDSLDRVALDAECANVDLAVVPGLPASALTGHVALDGRGQRPANFTGTIRADLGPSGAAGRRIDRLTARSSWNSGAGTIDSFLVAFGGGGSVAAAGAITLHGTPTYDLHVVADAFNVAAVTMDEKITSITGTIDVRGSGVSMDSLMLNPLSVRMAEGTVYGRRIPAFAATVHHYHPRPGHTTTHLVSDMGTVTLDGAYRLDQAIDRFVAIGNDIVLFLGDTLLRPFVPLDASWGVPTPRTSPFPAPVNLQFAATVTNPNLISAFLETSLGGQVTFDGTLASDSTGSRQTVNAQFGSFTLRNPKTYLHLGRTRLGITVRDDYRPIMEAPLSPDDGSLARTSDGRLTAPPVRRVLHVHEGITVDGASDSLRVNNLLLGTPRVFAQYDGGALRVSSAAVIDGQPTHAVRLATDGIVRGTEYRARIDTLAIIRGDTIRWALAPSGTLSFHSGAMLFDNVGIASDSTVVRLNGVLDGATMDNLEVTLTKLDLAGLKRYAKLELFDGLGGRIDSMDVWLNGTMSAPTIDMRRLHGGGIEFRRNPFGDLDASLRAEGMRVHGNVHLGFTRAMTAASTEEVHRVDIDVRDFPFNPAFGSVEQRIPDNMAVDVRADAVAFPIGFLELIFSPTVDRLGGYTTGKMAIAGTTPGVRYNGALALNDVRFRASATNIMYEAEGDITLRNDTIEISQATLHNRGEDWPETWARVWGNLYFRGLTFKAFDMFAESDQLLVLSRKSQRPGSSAYGPLVVSTQPRSRHVESLGPDPSHAVRFYGTLDAPHLDGTLYTQYSDLIFPQTGTGAQGTGFAVTYDLEAATRRDTAAAGGGEEKVGLAEIVSGAGGLLDRMRYNLHIETEQDLKMTMDFSPTEKLKDVRLSGYANFVRGEDLRGHFGGTLRINGGSYLFYDDFTIDPLSTLVYTDDFGNPRLNIIARTPPRLHQPDESKPGEFVQVEVIITGTRQEPKMDLRLLVGPNSAQLRERTDKNVDENRTDALLFLAVHQFLEDFHIATGASTALVSPVATTLSQSLSTIFAQLGLPGTVNVQFDQEHPERTKVTVSLQASKFLVSLGANPQVQSGSGLDYSVTFSLGDVLGVVWLEQTRIRAEHRATQLAGTTMGGDQGGVFSVSMDATDFFTGVGRGLAAFWNWLTGSGTPAQTPQPPPKPTDTLRVVDRAK